MKPARAATLARIHRVRTVQLGLVEAEEAHAHAHAASETALGERIARLAVAVSPLPATGGGLTIAAAAHYRERLHQSAAAATVRTAAAADRVAHAQAATRAARQDRVAVEKLIERAEADGRLAAARAATAEAPSRGKRHASC